jgi:hypothetical protein
MAPLIIRAPAPSPFGDIEHHTGHRPIELRIHFPRQPHPLRRIRDHELLRLLGDAIDIESIERFANPSKVSRRASSDAAGVTAEGRRDRCRARNRKRKP